MCRDCEEYGLSKQPAEVPGFLSRQPPRSEGESLLQRIFARQTAAPRWPSQARPSEDSSRRQSA
jgi:hypothetical protein